MLETTSRGNISELDFPAKLEQNGHMEGRTARHSKRLAPEQSLKAIHSMPADEIAEVGSKLLLNMSVAEVASLVQNRSGSVNEILLGSIVLNGIKEGDLEILFALVDRIIDAPVTQ